MVRLVLIFILGLSLQACANLASGARINPNTIAAYDLDNLPTNSGLNNSQDNDVCNHLYGESVSRPGAIDLDCFRFPGDENIAYRVAALQSVTVRGGNNPNNGLVDLTNAASIARAKLYRNRLESVLLKRADDMCTVEKGRIFANEAFVNTSLGFATTALSTVSTIVTGDLAKTILSGGAAITSSTQDHVNANVYRNQLTQAITKAMDGNRANDINTMVALRSKNAIEYPVDEMIRLANRYHQSCSFENGLQTLLEAAVNKEGVDRIYRERAIGSAITKLETRRAKFKSESDEYKALSKSLSELITAETAIISGTSNTGGEAPSNGDGSQ